jgi:biotin-[acetyl-CoA-carboxylase] ligase BirA-like protein
VQPGSLARARGVRLFLLDEVDSTNEEARRLIETGERGPLWIVAHRQTRGRGRLGREWISPKGNFHGSFVFSDFSGVQIGPQLGFVTGVAAIRALRAVVGATDFLLKWPNDLVYQGGKLGGILLECVSGARGPVAILGVGVNIVAAPEGLPYAARALYSHGVHATSCEAFFTAFSDALIEVLDIWAGGDGFAHIREEWLRSAAGIGDCIRVMLTGETIDGRFETIDASGRLVLVTTDGARVIEAGDVLLGPRASTIAETRA